MEILALLQIHVEKKQVGSQPTPVQFVHEERKEIHTVAALDGLRVVADVELVGKRQEHFDLLLDVAASLADRRHRTQDVVLRLLQTRSVQRGVLHRR